MGTEQCVWKGVGLKSEPEGRGVHELEMNMGLEWGKISKVPTNRGKISKKSSRKAHPYTIG